MRIARNSSTPPTAVHRDKPTVSGKVVSLASRRKRCTAGTPTAALSALPAEEGLNVAAAHWERVLGAAGLDFSTPVPPADLVPLITAELERLLGGLVFVREGGGPMDLIADPDAGMDALSAVECAGLLRDLCAVAERGRARSHRPE